MSLKLSHKTLAEAHHLGIRLASRAEVRATFGTAHVTLAEIAEDMNLKRERVRQIGDKAIRKIGKNHA